MYRVAFLLFALVLVGCGSLTINVPDLNPPAEPPTADEPAGPYDHLQRRTSFSPKSNVQLKEGCYVGDFVLGRSQLKVAGVGVEKTVIDGNLVLQTQCRVSNLTVTGDVIFEGHQAQLENVDFLGRIVDKGLQNRY